MTAGFAGWIGDLFDWFSRLGEDLNDVAGNWWFLAIASRSRTTRRWHSGPRSGRRWRSTSSSRSSASCAPAATSAPP
ncbi:MAG: hypothetical protein QM733_00345 [Ilumatobacteraceae bacterium]